MPFSWEFISHPFTMSILDWFARQKKNTPSNSKLNLPNDLWVKCFDCGDILYLKELQENGKVCLKCNYHFRLSPSERIELTCDPGSFTSIDEGLHATDPLHFSDTQPYGTRLKTAQAKTGSRDAIETGTATIRGIAVAIGVMNFGFLGGSMGAVVGEKISRLIDKAIQDRLPVVIFSLSGGARMQEGLFSLMQMAKTAVSVDQLDREKLPYIVILCDPTTGGTSASFAMLGDITFAEPGALVSFAGPRVIEQTIRQTLPDGFQRSEFLLEHGMVDAVIHRSHIPETLARVLSMMMNHPVSQ